MVLVLWTMAMAGVPTITQSPAFGLFLAYLQAFELPESMNTLEIYSPAFLPQQHGDATTTISGPAKCQLVHIENQLPFLLADLVAITLRGTSLAKGSANPSL